MKAEVVGMQLLENGSGTDQLHLEFSKEAAQEVRGDYFEVFGGLSARMEISRGHGREAVMRLRALFGDCPVVVIDMKTGEKTEI